MLPKSPVPSATRTADQSLPGETSTTVTLRVTTPRPDQFAWSICTLRELMTLDTTATWPMCIRPVARKFRMLPTSGRPPRSYTPAALSHQFAALPANSMPVFSRANGTHCSPPVEYPDR